MQLTRRIRRAHQAPPVFVDETGRRHLLFLVVASLFAFLSVLAVLFFWLSQTGPPVGPS